LSQASPNFQAPLEQEVGFAGGGDVAMMSQDELAQVLSCGIEGLKLLDFVSSGLR